jgi:hypothetical protein
MLGEDSPPPLIGFALPRDAVAGLFEAEVEPSDA